MKIQKNSISEMKNKGFFRLLYFQMLLLFVLCSFTTTNQTIDVKITGMRSTQGVIIIKIFKNDNDFQKDIAVRTLFFKKESVSKGEMTVKLHLDNTIYGLALLDDENNDNKMNYNFIGLPNEGFGFSNYYHTSLTRPKFDAFKFSPGINQKVVMQIRYM